MYKKKDLSIPKLNMIMLIMMTETCLQPLTTDDIITEAYFSSITWTYTLTQCHISIRLRQFSMECLIWHINYLVPSIIGLSCIQRH